MRKKSRAATRAKSRPDALCLECDYCRAAPVIGRGEDYICIKLGKSIALRDLWGRACKHFAPIQESRP